MKSSEVCREGELNSSFFAPILEEEELWRRRSLGGVDSCWILEAIFSLMVICNKASKLHVEDKECKRKEERICAPLGDDLSTRAFFLSTSTSCQWGSL